MEDVSGDEDHTKGVCQEIKASWSPLFSTACPSHSNDCANALFLQWHTDYDTIKHLMGASQRLTGKAKLLCTQFHLDEMLSLASDQVLLKRAARYVEKKATKSAPGTV